MDSVGESGKQDLGAASRSLLEFALSKEASTQFLLTNAIRLVCRTFATDPAASKALLARILAEPCFSRHAHEEAQWLAEGVPFIASADPEFVAQIYDVLFRRPTPQTGTSWFGGVPSGILPLTSTREQDYEHSRWRLGRAFPEFLHAAPYEATQAASVAAIGTASMRSQGEPKRECEINFKDGTLRLVETNPIPEDWMKEQKKEGKPSERILADFAKFLRECPEEDFRISVDAAIKNTSATSLWARLLGIGAQRPGIADDLLWQIASLPEFLKLSGVSRDAIEFLAKAHPHRTPGQQADFEKELFSSASTGSNKEANWMRSLAARFLSVVPQETLATKEMRQLRSELDSENRLAGNPPFLSTKLMANPASEIEDLLLKRPGVNLENGPDRELRSVTRSLDKLMTSWSNEVGPSDVSDLWRSTKQVVATIDRLVNPAPHEKILHAAWGSISNAVERICESEEYDPTAADHPQLPELLELLARLSQSDYPAASELDGSGLMGSDYMSWGGHDVRVFATSALVLLASRFGDSEATLVPRLKPFLSDPVPAVRLQVVQSLHALRSHASPQMWEMIEFVAREEGRLGLLGLLVAESLYQLSDSEPELCETLTERIQDRFSPMLGEAGEDERTSFCSAISLLAARLWIFGGSARACLDRCLDGRCSPMEHLPSALDFVSERGAFLPLQAEWRCRCGGPEAGDGSA